MPKTQLTAGTFTPSPETQHDMRAALGLFATGVTVVTANSPLGPMGITVNSFTSVSMDPPLILWCPAKSSKRHDTFAGASNFALHIMGEDQDDVARGFVRAADAFDGVDWVPSDRDVPLIQSCPARFECHIRDRIDAGDHTVIIGHVDRVTVTRAVPRVFMSGAWGAFLHPEDL
ncbi:flavin reductase family protein [Maritimibacter sp. DP1N21-5]|uniref:flavin reductase family protein n=1 Tax=Maritimibacter sp. DP1N21-5 TaxID=2836867 RepID=UPI001C44BBD6|nr:flavin reductase family protein [Maritimibacter sp. DP1N21-5]MBV7409585.1 flavin reductase family protein [Maritimibacter sp. DP1N21-5]